MPFRKKFLMYLGVFVLTTDILSISYFRILDRFELVTLDFRYSLRLIFPQKVNPDIVFVEIGEDTLRFLGKWPLPRDYHATLIEVLNKFGARAILFDILFCEPSGWDKVLVESAKKAGNVYFPFAFRLDGQKGKGILEAAGVDAPLLPDLKEASKGIGFINKAIDIDGKVRRAPVFVEFHGSHYYSLAFQAAADYLGLEPASISAGSLPIDENGTLLLNFAGRWAEVFQHYSYLDLLAAYQEMSEGKSPRIDPDKLKGKVCFVGLTATGTQELGPIPIEGSYPMLGIHANLFNMLTEGVYLKRFSKLGNLAILILFVSCLLFFIVRLKPFIAFLILLGLILLLLMGSVLVFTFMGVWLDIVCPVLTLLGVYIGMTIYRYISEIRVRERIQKELAVAASIQKCFLPAEVPSPKGLDIAVEMKTAKEVGGDLYDFVKLDENRIGIMLGDVSGKGVPASLFMARVETLFKVYSKGAENPSNVISRLNGEVSCDERAGLFTTLLYAIFDTAKMRLRFSDAGHLPLILIHNGAAQKLTSEDGMAVGIMPEASFSDKVVNLSKGDIVVFYTDGITEARDIKGNEFGTDRLSRLLEASHTFSARQILNTVLNEVKHFQGKALQHDDITLIVASIIGS